MSSNSFRFRDLNHFRVARYFADSLQTATCRTGRKVVPEKLTLKSKSKLKHMVYVIYYKKVNQNLEKDGSQYVSLYWENTKRSFHELIVKSCYMRIKNKPTLITIYVLLAIYVCTLHT